MAKNISQLVRIKASPSEVFAALVDSEKHAAFTGAPASIEPRAGGQFSAYDGYITGMITELLQDKLLVLQWNGDQFQSQARRSAVDETLKQGHYSSVTFMLDAEEDGTRLRFFQQGVPDELYDELADGWHEHYWDKLKAALER